MEKIEKFVEVYEDYISNRKKLLSSRKTPRLKTLGVMIVLIVIAYFGGLVVGALNNVGYLLTVGNIIILTSYVVYKVFRVKKYNKVFEKTYPILLVVGMNVLYIFITVMLASLFLLLVVYHSAVSWILILIYLVLVLVASIIYFNIYKKAKNIVLPNIIRLILNGFFIGVLFYSLTVVVHVNNIPISFIIVAPLVLVTVVLKQYFEKKFIFRTNRIVVVSFGIFLIILSLPFARAFNFASVWRGELTLNIVYETLGEEIHEFSKGVNGDVMFYEDYVVIAGDEYIRFYDEDFKIALTLDNDYSAVYVMNGKLHANKVTDITSHYIDLYEFDVNSFSLLGAFYTSYPDDKVYVEGDAYFSVDGYVYMMDELTGEFNYIESDSITDLAVSEQQDDYILFRKTTPVLATTYSFREPLQGSTYKNVAYNNDHLAFIYTGGFVGRNISQVDPLDDVRVVVYLTSVDDYFKVDAEVPPTFLMPKLYRINEFHYVDGYYYLIGYVEYSTHDYNYRVIVVNVDGDIEREFIYEGPSFAMSEEYIVYGDKTIKVYPVDAETTHIYRIIEGYGTMFITMSLVALFAVERIQLDAKKKKKLIV